MIAKTRKPISVLLAVLMIVGLYASIPFTASAGAPGWYETDFADLKDGDVVIIINTYTGSDEDEDFMYAMMNNQGAGGSPLAPKMSITANGTLDFDEEEKGEDDTLYDCAWIFNTTEDEGDFTLTNYYDTDTWLYCDNKDQGVRVGTKSENIFSIQDGYLFNNIRGRYTAENAVAEGDTLVWTVTRVFRAADAGERTVKTKSISGWTTMDDAVITVALAQAE